jgi:hypothetical protein
MAGVELRASEAWYERGYQDEDPRRG